MCGCGRLASGTSAARSAVSLNSLWTAGTRFAPKLKEGARFGDGKARRVQTCGYYDAFRGSKTSFSVVSATWHLAPCPPAACAIAHGSGAGDGSPKRPHKYARRLVRMVFQALCHRVLTKHTMTQCLKLLTPPFPVSPGGSQSHSGSRPYGFITLQYGLKIPETAHTKIVQGGDTCP